MPRKKFQPDPNDPYLFRGKPYPLRIEDVVRISGRAPRWVYVHADLLRGVKRAWDGGKRETVRFNEDIVRARLDALGVPPRSPEEVAALAAAS